MIRRISRLMQIFDEPVLIDDNLFDSEYFRVSDIPTEFTAGKNLFRIYPDRRILLPKTEVLIQITDAGGNPLYHHVNTYVDAAGRILIGVWIYPETPVGVGKIAIMGVATNRPGGRSVSGFWNERYNVRWERDIPISPHKQNYTPILFNKIPGVKTYEKQREYLTQTYSAGTAATQSSTGDITYTYAGYGQADVTISGGTFSPDMEGGTLEVPNPGYTFPAGTTLVPGESLQYVAYVSQVVNSTQLKVAPLLYSVNQQVGASKSGGGNVATAQTVHAVNYFGPISNYTMSWDQEAIYASGSNNIQSFASVTLKNIEPMVGSVHKIRTFIKSKGFANYELAAEEVLMDRDLLINVDSALAYDRVGNYMNQNIIDTYWASESVNQPGNEFRNVHSDSEMISSMVITGSSVLSGSTNYPDAPLASDPYIKVFSKPDIEIYKDNDYQVKFRVACEADPVGQTSSSYMDIYISGSNIGASDDRNIGTKLVTLQTTNVAPGNTTAVNLFVGLNNLLNNPSSGVNNPVATFGGTFSSAGAGSTAAMPGEGEVLVAANFASNTAATAAQIQSFNYGQLDERLLELVFRPDEDTDAHIVFAVTRGRWHISDVQLVGAKDYGFTPNHTFFEIPIKTSQQDDVLDFKFEFLNSRGEIANISLITQSMDFTGSNTYINGPNNEISGSLFIGDGLVMVGFHPPVGGV